MGDRITALELHNNAVALINDKTNPSNPQMAYSMFCSAVMADPTFAEGWYKIGIAVGDMGMLNGSVAAFRRMLELPVDEKPGGFTSDMKGKALVNIAHRLHHIGENKEAKKFIDEAVKIGPNMSLAWMNKSLIHAEDGELDEALVTAAKAFAMDKSPAVEVALGFANLFKGDYKQGLLHHEARFPYTMQNFLAFPFPKWRGEEGKTVFVTADQGLGDTLSFSRFLEDASKRAKYLYVGVQSELRRVFTTAFRHIENMELIPLPCGFPPATNWTTFMSLPFALGLSNDEIISKPGIYIDRPGSPTNWKSSDRKLHVGIAWGGSPANFIDKWRSIPLVQFLDLYKVPGIQLYSLQVGERAGELHALGMATTVRDLSPYIRDVSDSIGIIQELDLVITCESALGHIAGACDVETWIPYSYHGRDFRLGYDGSNPLWYKRHQVFKQGPDAQWGPVFERIVERLRGRV